jgi:PAS domain S-box-containing protein
MERVSPNVPDLEFFRAMAELSTDFIGMATADGTTLYVNPAGRQLCGIDPTDDLRRLSLSDFHPPGDAVSRVRAGLSEALKKGNWRGETVLLGADGTHIPGHQLIIAHDSKVGGAPVLSTVIRDNRAIQDLESKLAHAQRLESIGRLAGGVAHDFNNLITVIDNYVELVRSGLPTDSPARQDLDVALEATAKAATLCRQLLSFARKGVIRPQLTDLSSSVEQFGSLVQRVVGEHIRVEVDLAEGPCFVNLDPGQLDQILANLAVNSRDAMPQGGLLTISTGRFSSDGSDSLPAGDFVELGFSDTGAGMTEAVRQRAFEPFFTTKKAGQGAGMGLSTVYGAVTQNGGHVFLESAPGQGTRIRILWPQARALPQESSAKKRKHVHVGSECILVVEDEDMVRVLSARALRSAGYEVLDAASPSQALELVDVHGPRLDLLLTDVVMPDMNGRILSEHVRQKLPDLPVLFMSGYTDSALGEGGVLAPGVDLLPKPFSRDQLLAKVREVLQEQGEDSRNDGGAGQVGEG